MAATPLTAILFLCFLGTVTAQLGYDCRRKGMSCKGVAATCPMMGTLCTCPDGSEGYDCGLTTANIDPQCSSGTGTAPQCENEATCLNGDSCYCNQETYGSKCQNYRVAVWCSETEMFINVNPDGAFEGKVFVSADLETDDSPRDVADCQLTQIATGVPASLPPYVLDANQAQPTELAGYFIQILHTPGGVSPVCGDAVPVQVTNESDTTQVIRTDYIRQVAIEYNPNVMSSLDQMLNQVNISDTIEPIRFEILDAFGRAITNSVKLGDDINLKFTLVSQEYAKIKIKDCKATSGAEGASEITFFTDNCPATDWAELFRGYMVEDEATKSATLKLSAFRFIGDSDTVTFICSCKLCTDANLAECERNAACAEPSNTTSGDGTSDQSGGDQGSTAAPGAPTTAPGAPTAAPGAPTTAPNAPPAGVRRKRAALKDETELRKGITVRTGPQASVQGTLTCLVTFLLAGDCLPLDLLPSITLNYLSLSKVFAPAYSGCVCVSW
ncbi:hypothetical protein BaRGS_00023699 [Batillaria attramentaria]|uniref:ZP domain-containing protein n=1 Tax=Batillaria attramentaria TaxID=370345 RepID=A0ABD0KDN2_9CAEN